MINVKIVTPKGVKATFEAEYVEYVTVEGGMGVLTNRLPIVAKLKVAPLKIRTTDNQTVYFAIHGGILDMDGKELTIITTAAERPEDIDVETTMKAIEDAKELLKNSKTEMEKTKVQAEIQKNMIRMNIGKIK